MKLRTTTPASVHAIGRSMIVLSVIAMAFATQIQLATTAKADDFDARIKALEQDIDLYDNKPTLFSEK
jgi:hypothetical protein